MRYYSTNGKSAPATLEQAVINGLADDGGLYMPEYIPRLPDSFFREMAAMDFQEIACTVADAFFGEDVPEDVLHGIVRDTLAFDCPVVKVTDDIWSLELFHGPTLAFKDVGARFMARLLGYFTSRGDSGLGNSGSASSGAGAGDGVYGRRTVNVLAATSGDTGSAVANGFWGVEGVHVHVLYPKGQVSKVQESQFATLGGNVTALEVDGTFDDCQALVKKAFMDSDLKESLYLTSANSINVARFLPQMFYYFYAYAQMLRLGRADNLTICVPSGNFGNLCAALFARRAGLPVKHFVAANNANDVFCEFMSTGQFAPRASVRTLANAMDVGNPSNFARIYDLYGKDVDAMRQDISASWVDDDTIRSTIKSCYERYGYTLDPHGACAFKVLGDYMTAASESRTAESGTAGDGAAEVGAAEVGLAEAGAAGSGVAEVGVFLETAHPAKFASVVESATGVPVEIPERLAAFANRAKLSIPLAADYSAFKAYLLSTIPR